MLTPRQYENLAIEADDHGLSVESIAFGAHDATYVLTYSPGAAKEERYAIYGFGSVPLFDADSRYRAYGDRYDAFKYFALIVGSY